MIENWCSYGLSNCARCFIPRLDLRNTKIIKKDYLVESCLFCIFDANVTSFEPTFGLWADALLWDWVEYLAIVGAVITTQNCSKNLNQLNRILLSSNYLRSLIAINTNLLCQKLSIVRYFLKTLLCRTLAFSCARKVALRAILTNGSVIIWTLSLFKWMIWRIILTGEQATQS